MEQIMEKIVNEKKRTINNLKPYTHQELMDIITLAQNRINPWNLFFLQDKEPMIIAEIKIGSPSRGSIIKSDTVSYYLDEYHRGGASAISVVTEENFFQGSVTLLREVIQQTHLPVLRKDFILEDTQIYQSIQLGVGALLLIARILSQEKLHHFIDLCRLVNLIPLVEVHDRNDLEKAIMAQAQYIGINNRNLSTFEVSLNTTVTLLPLVPKPITVVCESGIKSREDIQRFRDLGVNHFLIGEYLLFHSRPRDALQTLRRGK